MGIGSVRQNQCTGEMVLKIRRYRGRLSSLVKEELLEMIVNGDMNAGDQLPSEDRLAEQLEVSRPTLREALRMLEIEGYIARYQGKGTFVTERTNLQSGLEYWRSISEIIERSGKTVKAKSIRMSEGVFEKEIHDKLGIDSREVCLRLERIRTADGEPVSCSIDYIPRKVFGYTELTEAMFEKSLVHTMETSFGVHIQYSMTYLVPVVVDDEMAEELEIDRNSPVLLLDEVHYDAKDRPVFYGKEYFPYSKVKFHIIRQRAT